MEEADGKIGLEYEIDVETETFEMFQMPQLSRGKYLHDFKVRIVKFVHYKYLYLDYDLSCTLIASNFCTKTAT